MPPVTHYGDRMAPVVLLHGLSQQRHFWDPVIRRMRSRPVTAPDQRGHGDNDLPEDADYSLDACATDVVALLDDQRWPRAVVIGHSWGASVALRAAAQAPDRVAAVGLVDGGLWSPADLGPREEVRTRLTPPALGIPEVELWAMVRAGGLPWSTEIEDALRPTYVVGSDGLARTRIGMARHMRVLDGLLDADPARDLDSCADAGLPVWAVVCEPAMPAEPGTLAASGQDVRASAATGAARRPNVLVHRWPGALHDVPLQWPALVAGFVDALVEDCGGLE